MIVTWGSYAGYRLRLLELVIKEERYRFWNSIIGERARGLLTNCQTPYQLQFGIRLKNDDTNTIYKAYYII